MLEEVETLGEALPPLNDRLPGQSYICSFPIPCMTPPPLLQPLPEFLDPPLLLAGFVVDRSHTCQPREGRSLDRLTKIPGF